MHQLTIETVDTFIEMLAGGRCEIDLHNTRFVDPYALLILDLLLAERRDMGQPLHVVWPDAVSVRGWMQSMGLDDRASSVSSGPRKDVAGTLQPITRIEDETAVGRVVEGFHRRLADRYPLTESSRRALVAVMIELFQNIPHHSNATGEIEDPRGIAAMQDYETSIFVAIADKGVGLAASLGLREGYEGLSDAGALDVIFHQGVSRFDDPGRGGELRRIAELVRSWDGTFALRTGKALYYFDPRGGDTYDVPRFPGVQLALRLPIRAVLA